MRSGEALGAEQALHRFAEARRQLAERAPLVGTRELRDFDEKVSRLMRDLRNPHRSEPLVFKRLQEVARAFDRLSSRSSVLAELEGLRRRRDAEHRKLSFGALATLPSIRSLDLVLARAEKQLEAGHHARARASLALAARWLESWREAPREGIEQLEERRSLWGRRDQTHEKTLKKLMDEGASGLVARLLDELAIIMGSFDSRGSSAAETSALLLKEAQSVAPRLEAWLTNARRRHGSG